VDIGKIERIIEIERTDEALPARDPQTAPAREPVVPV
jgi:hypothetical protein